MNKLLLAAALAMTIFGMTPTSAQSPNLAGKTVNLFIGAGPGGGFDLWGRTVARYIGKHLPGNPTIVPQNMPGAGGLLAANHIYNVAPKDGTALAIIAPSAPLAPITGVAGARFDTTKFTWVGTPTIETPACAAFNVPQAKVRTVKDLYEQELVVGSTGVGNGTYRWPKALNALLGMKFKIVTGFPSSSNVLLAMERGEVDGLCTILDTISTQRADWIQNRKILILLQGGVAPHPSIKDVPSIIDQARSSDDKAAIEFLFAGNGLGRPFVAPPGIAADRVKMLQDAFMATMKEPELLADVRRQNLPFEPRDGLHLAALIQKIYATPKSIVDKVADLTK